MAFVPITIAGGGTPFNARSVRSFVVLAASTGATFTLDGGNFPIFPGSFDCIPRDDGSYPELQFTPGTTAPLQLLIDISEGQQDPARVVTFNPGPGSNQEGDLIPSAAVAGSAATSAGGTAAMFRGPGGKYTIGTVSAAGNIQADIPNGVSNAGFFTPKPVSILHVTGANSFSTGSTSIASPFDKIFGLFNFATAGAVSAGLELDVTIGGDLYKLNSPAIGGVVTALTFGIAWGFDAASTPGVNGSGFIFNIPGTPTNPFTISLLAAGITAGSVNADLFKSY